MCVRLHVNMCMCACLETRTECVQILFIVSVGEGKTGSLVDLELPKQAGLACQQTPEITSVHLLVRYTVNI